MTSVDRMFLSCTDVLALNLHVNKGLSSFIAIVDLKGASVEFESHATLPRDHRDSFFERLRYGRSDHTFLAQYQVKYFFVIPVPGSCSNSDLLWTPGHTPIMHPFRQSFGLLSLYLSWAVAVGTNITLRQAGHNAGIYMGSQFKLSEIHNNSDPTYRESESLLHS